MIGRPEWLRSRPARSLTGLVSRRLRAAALALTYLWVLAVPGVLLAATPASAATGTTIDAYSDCGGASVGAGQALVNALQAAQDGNTSGECSGLGARLTGPYTIVLDPTKGPYVLNTVNNYSDGPDGLPAIVDTVTIESSSTTDAVVERSTASGTPDFRFFDVAAPTSSSCTASSSGVPCPQYQTPSDVTNQTTTLVPSPGGNLTLQHIELENGYARGGNGADGGGGGAGLGGAIFSHGGSVTLVDSLLQGNTAQGGFGGPLNGIGAGGGGGMGGFGGSDLSTGTTPGGGGGTQGYGVTGATNIAGGGPNGGSYGGDGGYDGGGDGLEGHGYAGGFGGGGGGGGAFAFYPVDGSSGGFGGGGGGGGCGPGPQGTSIGGAGGFGGGGGGGNSLQCDAGTGGTGGAGGFGGGAAFNLYGDGGGGGGMGGAIFVLGGNLSLSGDTFASNLASGGQGFGSGSGYGGAIFVDSTDNGTAGYSIASTTFSTSSPNTVFGASALKPDVYTYGTPLEVSNASLPGGTFGTAYPSQTLKATGGTAPYTWKATGLPAGLSLTVSGSTYAITGTPTEVGTFSVKLKVTDNSASTATQILLLAVDKGATTTTLTSSANPSTASQKVTYTATVTGSGTPTGTVAFDDGGSAISGCGAQTLGSGRVTCSVTYTASGTHHITAVYSGDSDFATSTSAALDQTVNPAPAVATTSLPAATLGQSYDQPLSATGGTAPMGWTASGLPTGLAVTVSGSTYAIVGTPTEVGTFSVKLAVTDSNAVTTTQTLSLAVLAANGSGAAAVSPTHVTAGSAGNDLNFTYTAATGGTVDGSVYLSVPAGWTAPQAASSAGAGYVAATGGSGTDAVSVTGTGPWTVAVSAVTLTTGQQLTITYSGATPPTTAGTDTFSVKEAWTSGGTLTPLAASPTVTVNASADGSGTMSVSPGSVVAGSTGNTLSFTYTAATGGLTGGVVELTVPAGWSAPTAGNVTASTGTVGTISGTGPWTVPVAGVSLSAGQTLTITYSGAVAPAAAGTATFPVSVASTASGTPAALATPPSVMVTAGAAGSATLTPQVYSLAVGTTTTVAGAVYDSHGNPVPDPAVTLTATAGSFGTVSTTVYGGYSATFHAPSEPGSVTVAASVYGGVTAQTMLLVTPQGTAAPHVSVSSGQASVSGLTATGKGGSGDVQVADYSGNPGGSLTFNASGVYFDVALSADNTFTSLTVQRCGVSAGQTLYWWNGTAWAAVSTSPAPSYDATTGCLSVTLNSNSSPSLAQLTGTPFAVGTPVTGGGGGGAGASAVATAPFVSAIAPSGGPAAGGTTVTISGSGFTGASTVEFGVTPAASFTVDSDGQITAVSPAGTGTVDVTVTTPSGTSAADQFTYQAPVSVTVPAAPAFSDVPSSYWAYADIEQLVGKGIVNGFPDGTFRPDAAVTRAQFVKMLVLTLGLKPSSTPTPFTDVAPSAWYAPYVSAAVRAGIVDGVSPTRFDPNGTLTREQMAVLLARALKLTGTATLRFGDDAGIAPWALTGVEEAVAAGYIDGFPNGTFQPLGTATRAQTAKVLAMVLQQMGS